MITKSIQDAFKRAEKQHWWKLYIAIDIHGVMFESTSVVERQRIFLPGALETLRYLSSRRDIEMFLFSCSHSKELWEVKDFLAKNNVNVAPMPDYTEISSMGRGNYLLKPYYNLLLDDKGGFEANEWLAVLAEFKKYPLLPTELEAKRLGYRENSI